jgi:hypothetical protein
MKMPGIGQSKPSTNVQRRANSKAPDRLALLAQRSLLTPRSLFLGFSFVVSVCFSVTPRLGGESHFGLASNLSL